MTEKLDEEYELYDYYVDLFENEGIVAYKSKSDMVIISTDEIYFPWGPTDDLVYKHDSLPRNGELGVTMLQCMLAKGIEQYPAMEWCNEKNHGMLPNTGSWRLPTYYEWSLMLDDDGKNLSALNKALHDVGGIMIDDDLNHKYWTCVEDHVDYIVFNTHDSDYDATNRAIAVSANLLFRVDKDYWLKKTYHYVRAVKYVVLEED